MFNARIRLNYHELFAESVFDAMIVRTNYYQPMKTHAGSRLPTKERNK